ncbi:MAG: hypothetical protein LBI29_01220 [Rickettsiales bacterium]|jgi:predicted transposase/invertase (TIGR01784 family)|nr:hypothetical protein [Rickettsiales bacterium]
MAELKKISGDKNFRIQYGACLMAKNDRIAAETTAMERGIVKGIEKGRKEGKRDTALLMLKDGVSVSTIVKYTEIIKEEITKLAKEQK